MFRYYNKFLPDIFEGFFVSNVNVHSHSTRQANMLHTQIVQTDFMPHAPFANGNNDLLWGVIEDWKLRLATPDQHRDLDEPYLFPSSTRPPVHKRVKVDQYRVKMELRTKQSAANFDVFAHSAYSVHSKLNVYSPHISHNSVFGCQQFSLVQHVVSFSTTT